MFVVEFVIIRALWNSFAVTHYSYLSLVEHKQQEHVPLLLLRSTSFRAHIHIWRAHLNIIHLKFVFHIAKIEIPSYIFETRLLLIDVWSCSKPTYKFTNVVMLVFSKSRFLINDFNSADLMLRVVKKTTKKMIMAIEIKLTQIVATSGRAILPNYCILPFGSKLFTIRSYFVPLFLYQTVWNQPIILLHLRIPLLYFKFSFGLSFVIFKWITYNLDYFC